MTAYTCESCQEHLIEFATGELPVLVGQRIDRHLRSCSRCSELLAELWDLQQRASHWQDQRVPEWRRRGLFFEPSPWPLRLQWVATAASLCLLMAAVLMVTSLEARIDQKIADSEVHQARSLRAASDEFRRQQLQTTQVLYQNLLDQSRSERREELKGLLLLVDDLSDARYEGTQQNLSYLIASQTLDRRAIEKLNAAVIQQADFTR
jgi:hypothetical protein